MILAFELIIFSSAQEAAGDGLSAYARLCDYARTFPEAFIYDPMSGYAWHRDIMACGGLETSIGCQGSLQDGCRGVQQHVSPARPASHRRLAFEPGC